jgi:hypothetical protein
MIPDDATFYAYVRRAPAGGRLTQSQVDGFETVLGACREAALSDEQTAYVLATAWHETGGTMQPVKEAHGRTADQAIARLENAWAAGRLPQVSTPYWRRDADGKAWFGRGYVQITHRENYQRMADVLGVDLVGRPELAIDPEIAADILVVGMVRGLFASDASGSHSLGRYFTELSADPVGARRIVNGTDKAQLIRDHWLHFLAALEAANEAGRAGEPPADVAPEDGEPDRPRLATDPVVVGGGTLAAAATASPLLSAVSNPWALAALALLVGAGLFLLLSGRLKIARRAGA